MTDAFAQGYKIGSDLGYHFTGQAANDIKLNREAKRQELELNKIKTQAATQEMAYNKQKQDQEQRQSQMKNAIAAANLAMQNPAAMPLVTDAIQPLVENYFPGWKVSTFDSTNGMYNQQAMNDGAAMVLSATSPSADVKANPYAFPAEIAKARSQFLLVTNTETGESTPMHLNELLYMFGGRDGMAALIAADQQAKIEAQLKAQKQALENQKTLTDIEKTKTDTAKTQFEMGRDQMVQQRADQISNFNMQQNPNAPVFTQGNVDNKTGQVSFKRDQLKGSGDDTALPPDQQTARIDAATNTLDRIVQNNGSAMLYNFTDQEIRHALAEHSAATITGKTEAQRDAQRAAYYGGVAKKATELLRAAEAGVPGARDRYRVFKDVLGNDDNTFGKGKSADAKAQQFLGGVRSAIDTAVTITSGADANATGIIPNLIKNAKDLTNYDTGSQDFLKTLEVQNAFNQGEIYMIDSLYQNRLSNQVLKNLRTGSPWRSYEKNAMGVLSTLKRIQNQAGVYAENVSPSLRPEYTLVVEQLDKAVDNLESNLRVLSKFKDGNINGFAVFNGTGELDKAIAAAQQSDVLYSDGANVYVIPQHGKHERINLQDFKMSREEFGEFVKNNTPSIDIFNGIMSKTPFQDKRTAFDHLWR